MPQGGVDKGEDPRDAALRELWEETGVTADLVEVVAETDGWLPYDLPHDIVPKIWKGRYRGQEQKWFLLRFTGRDDQINIETDHPEFTKLEMAGTRHRLIEEIVPFKRDVYDAGGWLNAPKLRSLPADHRPARCREGAWSRPETPL